MKAFSLSILLFVILAAGCAHSPDPAASLPAADAPPQAPQVQVVSESTPIPQEEPETAVQPETKNVDDYRDVDDYGDIEIPEQVSGGAKVGIADPLEPFNRAMFHFNDKLYFWVLKPVAQGYEQVVPEPARVGVSNFFSNIASPIRFVNCLLQANFSGAASEIGRFVVNTLWGVGGLLDPASSEELKLSKQDEDFGQTLGVYGLGQGFYINWPILGPSSPRDTVGKAGDFFLHPFTYLTASWETFAGIYVFDKVNAASLSIGDYESLKEASIDPYVAVRDAYVQYRLKKVNRKGGKSPTEDSGLPKK